MVLKLTVKLSDFGMAQALQFEKSHLSVQGLAGTVRYMPPETFQPTEQGPRHVSKRVDVWALGMMLYQMLHMGRTPYDKYLVRGNIEAAIAIASPKIFKEVMQFNRRDVWTGERVLLEEGGEDEVDLRRDNMA